MAQARPIRDLPSTPGVSARGGYGGGAACLIGSGTRIRGRVSGDGDLTVDGTLEGPISLRGSLSIGDGGSVTTEAVDAVDVTVGGSLDGDVNAQGIVRLLPGARVRGNLKGSGIRIEDGARFAGRIDCDFDLPAVLGGGANGRSGGKR